MQTTRRQVLRALAAVPAAGLLPFSFACSLREEDDVPLSAAGGAAADGLTAFALDLHGQLAGASSASNVLASPWSAWTSLAMLAEGAQGATREQIVAAMGLDGPAGRAGSLRSGVGDLRARLERANRGKSLSLTTADALWTHLTFDLSQPAADALRQHFDAEINRVDFAGDPEGARKRINDWVASKTGGRIDDLMPAGSIEPLTRLVLTDAIHFKGAWAHEFSKNLTREGSFTRHDGSEVSVPMMQHSKHPAMPVSRVEDEGAGVSASAIEMNYKDGRTSFVAIVPDAHDGLSALERWLDPARLRTIFETMRDVDVSLTMPKMKLALDVSLVEPLKALGVRDAFDLGQADLSAFSSSGRRDLSVNAVQHAAFLEVDEEGAEAAAATGSGMVRASMPAPTRLDRPFLFLIRERTSGAILFLGRMADPTA